MEAFFESYSPNLTNKEKANPIFCLRRATKPQTLPEGNHLHFSNPKEQTNLGFMFNPSWDSDATDEKKKNDNNNQAANRTGKDALALCVAEKSRIILLAKRALKKDLKPFNPQERTSMKESYVRSLMGYRRNRRELHQPTSQVTN